MQPSGYLVDGIDLSPIGTIQGTTWRPTISTARTEVTIPGRHGVYFHPRPRFEAPQVTLHLLVEADSSVEDLWRAADRVSTTLAQPVTTLTRYFGSIRHEAVAQLVSTDFDPSQLKVGHFARATAVYTIPGVFWRGVGYEELRVPAGESTVQVDSTAPIVDAVVSFAGSAADPMLTDLTTGTGIGLIGTPGGARVFADAGTAQAWSGAAGNWAPTAASMSPRLDYPGAGMLQLTPSNVTAAPTLSGQTWAEAAVAWQDADVTWQPPDTVRSLRIHSTHAASIRFRRSYW